MQQYEWMKVSCCRIRRYEDLHATDHRGTGKDRDMEKPRIILEGYIPQNRPRLKSRVIQYEVEGMLKRGWSPELIAGPIKTHRKDLPSITYDNGLENSQYFMLKKTLGVTSWFCEPYQN